MRVGDDWAGCLGQEQGCSGLPPRWAPRKEQLTGVVATTGYSLQELQTPDKKKQVVRARRSVMQQLRLLGWSLSEIGSALLLDHTTVLYHLRKVAEPETRGALRHAFGSDTDRVESGGDDG